MMYFGGKVCYTVKNCMFGGVAHEWAKIKECQ